MIKEVSSRLRILLCIHLVIGALFIRPVPSFASPKTFEAAVIYVYYGDTVKVRDRDGRELKIRLYGIDAPETRHREKPGQPFGVKASKALRSKLLGRKASIEVRDVDRYGRSVCVVRLNGRDINLEMVREGWAWAYRTYLERPYTSVYIEAERDARARRAGLWKQDNPQPPWEFRRLMRDKSGR